MHWAAVSWAITMFFVNGGNIAVFQSPQSLTKTVGQTADLVCTYEGPAGIGGYKWHRGSKHGIEVSNSTDEYRGRVFRADEEDFRQRKKASIRIIQLGLRDTGFYICKVELARIGTAYGTGTILLVKHGDQNGEEGSNGQSNLKITPFVFAVRAVPLLIMVIVTLVVASRRRKTEGNNDSSECRNPHRREGEDKLQYATLNLQERNQTECCVNREAVLYASVK